MSFGIPVRNGLGLGLLASTTLATGNVGPALYLPFALTGTLDPRITFSRPSNATLYDSTGKLTYAPNNVLTYSQEFDNAAWTKTASGVAVAPSVTANAGIAPDGTTTADRVQFSLGGGTASGDISILRQNQTVAGNAIASFYVRSFDGVSTYNMITINGDGSSSPVTVTGSWTRVQSAVSLGGTNSQYGLRLRGGQTPTNSATADILMWGAQVESVTYQTTPRTYNATTSAAYYGPRFDYDPATLVARGLLTEGARTNLFLQSGAGTNAAWVTQNVTRTQSGTSIQGTSTLSLLSKTSNDTQVAYHQQGPFTVSSGATVTHWRILKAGNNASPAMSIYDTAHRQAVFNLSGNGSVSNVDSGVTASCRSLGSGFYLCAMTYTITGTSVFGTLWVSGRQGFNGAPGDSVYFDVGQLEVGALPTSYIPTAASAVARSADSATMTGTNFSSWYNQTAGTFVVEGQGVFQSGTLNVIAGTNEALAAINAAVWRIINFNSGTLATLSAQVDYANVKIAWALEAGASTSAASQNGASPVAFTRPGGTATTLYIGTAANGAFGQFNSQMWVKSLTYYNTRQPNSVLQSLTT